MATWKDLEVRIARLRAEISLHKISENQPNADDMLPVEPSLSLSLPIISHSKLHSLTS
jgi:hypothetical protein